jgi:2,4-dienoyl-CoA reductase-like NADH-dependent reductase (Old Yellow Enzyme family)
MNDTPTPQSQMLTTIEHFLAETQMSATAFGRLALRDPRFVFDLRQGRDCLSRTQTKALAFMKGYRDGPTLVNGPE